MSLPKQLLVGQVSAKTWPSAGKQGCVAHIPPKAFEKTDMLGNAESPEYCVAPCYGCGRLLRYISPITSAYLRPNTNIPILRPPKTQCLRTIQLSMNSFKTFTNGSHNPTFLELTHSSPTMTRSTTSRARFLRGLDAPPTFTTMVAMVARSRAIQLYSYHPRMAPVTRLSSG